MLEYETEGLRRMLFDVRIGVENEIFDEWQLALELERLGDAADELELLLPLDVMADLPEGELMDDLDDEAASAIAVIRSCRSFIDELNVDGS